MATVELEPITKTTPWPHQLAAWRFAVDKPAAMLALDMGTGKSKVAVDLLAAWDARRVLILAPLSVLGVWRREFQRHDPRGIEPVVIDRGSPATKLRRTTEAIEAGVPVVINYDSAWVGKVGELLAKTHWDAVICDESHRIKSHDAKSSRFAHRVGLKAARRLCLTGTPLPHSPLDVFGQYRFLDPSLFGTSWVAFRARYSVSHPMFPSKPLRYINRDELEGKMHSIAYRVTAAEVLSLPDAIHENREVELSPRVRAVYDSLAEEMVAQIDDGEITAANALVKLLRLQQITSGFVRLDGTHHYQQVCHEKQCALESLLDGLPDTEPVVVFCQFRHDLAVVEKVAEARGRTYGQVGANRRDLTERGEMRPETQVLGVQMRAGGVGIDLTRARYVVYYSVGYSLGDYDQSVARVHRPGQTRTTFYYHLIARDTIDEVIYEALQKRRDIVEEVLAGLKRQGAKP